MIEGGSIPPGGVPLVATLTPLLKALKTRDHEGLSKLRHALRTPLNQIIGYSELLMESAEETGSNMLVADLKRIHSGGGELLALINDALAPWKSKPARSTSRPPPRPARAPGRSDQLHRGLRDQGDRQRPSPGRQGPR